MISCHGLTLSVLHPALEALTADWQSLVVVVAGLPYNTDHHILVFPSSRSVLVPLYIVVVRIVRLQPSKREP